MTTSGRFLKPFLLMSGLGFLGILSLALSVRPIAERIRGLPDAADLPIPVLGILLLLQPTLLMLVGVALGTLLAEKAGLVSLIQRRLRRETGRTAEGWGSTLALAIAFASSAAAADLAFRSFFPAAFANLPRLDDVTWTGRLLGLLYGGITEELIMRFGLMTLLLWLGLRLTGGRGRSLLVWTAIMVSALAFAAGHLGVLAGAAPADQSILVARTLGLNGILGLFFGWLYVRRSLEHAMLAHAMTHVTFWMATPILLHIGHSLSK